MVTLSKNDIVGLSDLEVVALLLAAKTESIDSEKYALNLFRQRVIYNNLIFIVHTNRLEQH